MKFGDMQLVGQLPAVISVEKISSDYYLVKSVGLLEMFVLTTLEFGKVRMFPLNFIMVY
jgi:hypothetical protein